MKSRLIALLGILLQFNNSHALATLSVSEGYDSLSRIASAQLLESGRHHFEQREAAEALACFAIVSERYQEQMGDEEVQLCIRAMNNCACVYKYFYFDYLQAYEYFVKAYDLCEQHKFDEFLPVIMVNLGDLLNDYGTNYGSEALSDQARQIFSECMDYAVETKNWELMTTAFFNLSNQNYDLDLSRYSVLFNSDIPASTPDLAFARLQYDGIREIQHHNYAAARHYFEQQPSAVSTKWAPERDTLATLLNIAYTYEQEHDYDHAMDYLLQALDLSDRHGITDHSAGICDMLGKLYAQRGDSAMASHYHIRYLEMKDAANDNRLASIGELNYIRELRKEEQKAQLMAQRHQLQQYVILAASIVLLLIMGLAVLLWRKNRQLTLRNRSLFEKNQQVMAAEAHELQLRKEYEEKYSHSKLSNEQRQRLDYRIQDLMSAPDIICQSDFTLARLAKMADSNTTYVSQVINEQYGMTFSNLLGSFRVREACRRMTDQEHYGNVTIEAIATSVGFKSRTAFFNAFKRETGLTPSEYQRMATSQKS